MIKQSIKTVAEVFVKIISVAMIFVCFILVYLLGVAQGYRMAANDAQVSFDQAIRDYVSSIAGNTPAVVSPTPSIKIVRPTSPPNWTGPELWEAVNKRRIEKGVNALSSRSELCTIASIRLNELLVLGTLDNHEGFSNMTDRRPDLKWIFEKYSTVAEFLALGGSTPQETVSMWENTLGHSKLLTGGEYVWGCIYAQNTFAVAIAAF